MDRAAIDDLNLVIDNKHDRIQNDSFFKVYIQD